MRSFAFHICLYLLFTIILTPMLRTVVIFLAILFFSFDTYAQGKGFTNLFDGKSLNGWKQVSGDAPYAVSDGEIVGTTVMGKVNSFLATEKTYGDFILELETKIEDSTINSGIQFRSFFDNKRGVVFGYQFEIDGSSRKWSGGVYDEARRLWLYPVSVNPSAQNAFKPNQYNKVRIECKGQIVSTWLNGTPVAYLVDTATTPGFIALQVHNVGSQAHAGKKIHWRNIRIKTDNVQLTPVPSSVFAVNFLLNELSEFEKKNGWQLLFDGKTTNGWKGAYQKGFPEKGWKVENGELIVLSSDGAESTNGGDIVTEKKFSAFDLTFDFKLTPGANSGLKYFVTLSENNKGSAIGLEYQLLDDTLHPDAKLGRDGNRTLASLYDLIKANKDPRFLKQPGNWNRARIIVTPNNHVEHYLNGIKVLEYERGSAAYRELVAISKYKIWPNFGEAPSGHILLQDHGNEVHFRNIKIKELR
jgi:hypothetical protein